MRGGGATFLHLFGFFLHVLRDCDSQPAECADAGRCTPQSPSAALRALNHCVHAIAAVVGDMRRHMEQLRFLIQMFVGEYAAKKRA